MSTFVKITLYIASYSHPYISDGWTLILQNQIFHKLLVISKLILEANFLAVSLMLIIHWDLVSPQLLSWFFLGGCSSHLLDAQFSPVPSLSSCFCCRRVTQISSEVLEPHFWLSGKRHIHSAAKTRGRVYTHRSSFWLYLFCYLPWVAQIQTSLNLLGSLPFLPAPRCCHC